MNVPIEECEEIIGYRQYWLLNDIEHKDIFKFLWDDCDTLQEFKELLYSDPNICNTRLPDGSSIMIARLRSSFFLNGSGGRNADFAWTVIRSLLSWKMLAPKI